MIERFFKRRDGMAAIEFALIAPLMVTLAFGAIEVSEAVSADARARRVANSVADVVSRESAVDNVEMTDLLAAAEAILFPFDASTLGVRISAVELDGAGSGEVLWSDADGMTALDVGDTVALPTAGGVPCAGVSVIFVEAQYAFSSPISYVTGVATWNFAHEGLACPRVTDPIVRTT